MSKLRSLIQNKPYLTWDIGNKAQLSEESIVEYILNYGNWEDYLIAEKTLGVKKIQALFNSLKQKTRVNLKPKTIHYFEKYYQRYA
ncbi:MAG: hypothetical protein ABIJ05_04950 [Patescibacteria group bacterium]